MNTWETWPGDLPEKTLWACVADSARSFSSTWYRIPHQVPPYRVEVINNKESITITTQMSSEWPDQMFLGVACAHILAGSGPYQFDLIISSLSQPTRVFRYEGNTVTVREPMPMPPPRPPKVVEITTSELPVAHLNTAYCAPLSHSGDGCTFELYWGIVLPRGITFDSELGAFAGTPTEVYNR